MTALLGSATFLEFRVASFNSDGAGSSVVDLTMFEGNFVPDPVSMVGYDVVYHTHPNGVVFYFEVLEAQDAGVYRLSHTGE